MINHARTLLLNDKALPDELGEEFVPEFAPLYLPRSLDRVHKILFGKQPIRQELNYKLRCIMQLLHATELAEFVLQLDPRVTYLPFDEVFWMRKLPREYFTAVCSLLSKLLTAEDKEALFGKAQEEPYKTFRNLWEQHTRIEYKLGGLILALVYRINEFAMEHGHA